MDAFGFPTMGAEVRKLDQDRQAMTPDTCAGGTSTTAPKAVGGGGGGATAPMPMPPRTHSSASLTNGKYYNPVVMSFIRDDWVQQQLQLRQSAYTVYHKTRVVTGTWNVNAKKPLTAADTAKILQWLEYQGRRRDDGPPDLIALGFQEIVDLNAVNVVVNNQSAQRGAQWEEAILGALNQAYSRPTGAPASLEPSTQQRDASYRLVLTKNLVGILLLVIVRADHVDHVREVFGATAGVGIMGMMGNKGGAAVRLSFYDSTLCFVCAHLAAHRENVTGRNADYMNILSKIDFKDNDESLTTDLRFFSGEPPILNHDFVFWLGDLNYRITDELSTEEVFQHAESGKYTELLGKEQLLIERKRGNVFHGFEEGPIRFAPTYKFQAGTSVYEKRPEKKLRAPAWCDRILWKAKIPAHVTLEHYDSVMGLDLSDHKPVHAFFEVQVKHQIETKKNQVIREIMLQLDKWENENMPKVRLLQGEQGNPCSGVVTFGHLKYGLEQTKNIFIENTGVVVAHFRFIPKLEDVTICKPWLRVTPSFGMIPPKERLEIRISARIDEDTAHGLTSGEDTLDDTMILRIENGRDYFIVVSGQYDPSCFGASIEQLIACPEPIRKSKIATATSTAFHIQQQPSVPAETNSANGTNEQGAQAQHGQGRGHGHGYQKVPKELWRMVNDLFQHSMDEKNLFVEAGNKQELVILREALDTGQAFPPHSSYAMAELLVAWLQSLRESVVPVDALASALAGGNGNVAQTCRLLLDALSPSRYNVLIYLIAFLKEVLKRGASNRLTPDKLAFVFSRCLVTQYKPRRDHTPHESPSHISSPPTSVGSTTSTASTASSFSVIQPQLPEDRLRQSAREVEIAQWNAAQRTDKLEKMLIHWLTTSAV